jgi:hypothetical protein
LHGAAVLSVSEHLRRKREKRYYGERHLIELHVEGLDVLGIVRHEDGPVVKLKLVGEGVQARTRAQVDVSKGDLIDDEQDTARRTSTRYFSCSFCRSRPQATGNSNFLPLFSNSFTASV